MLQPILVRVPPLSFSEYKSLNWAFIRKTRKSLFFLLPAVMGFVGFASLLPTYQKQGFLDSFSIISFLLGAVFVVGFCVFSLNRGIKKNYLNTPALAEGMTVTLADNSIALRSTSVSSEHPWPASYKKATRLGEWLLLSSGPASAYFLPINGVETPATSADLWALLRYKEVALTN